MSNTSPDDNVGSPYPDGIPNRHRMGFIPVGLVMGAHPAEFNDAIKTVAGLLDRPVQFEDEHKYVHEITAAAIHPETRWLAWVECICNDQDRRFVDVHFYLRAQMDGELAINWEIETYNPYFGCQVGYLNWHGKRLVMVYREKHNTYVAVLCRGGFRHHLQISDDWIVRDGFIVFIDKEEQNVRRLLLPRLQERRRLSLREARQAGYLEP
jgi:hypothetical protein